jgi:hypothetical protein
MVLVRSRPSRHRPTIVLSVGEAWCATSCAFRHTALETLAKRGYPKEELSRLRQLVDIASGEGTAAEEGDAEATGGAEQVRAVVDSHEHVDARRALYAWYREWSETARAVIKRRDFLVRLGLARLGLARRKTRAKVKRSPAAPPASDVL